MADEDTRTLIEAAYRHALEPAGNIRPFLRVWASKLMLGRHRRTLQGVFISPLIQNNASISGGALTLIDVSLLPDGTGLAFDWANTAAGIDTTLPIPWSKIHELPVPPRADAFAARLVSVRASEFHKAVTTSFAASIESGEVHLSGLRGSPIGDPTSLPAEAAPHIEIIDWIDGVIEVAGEKIFAVRVTPKPDPAVAFRESLENVKHQPGPLAQAIIGNVFPGGAPDRIQLSDYRLLTKVLKKYEDLVLTAPSDSTLLRAVGRKK